MFNPLRRWFCAELIAIRAELAIIRQNQETEMSDVANLNAAVQALKDEVGAIATEMDTLLADLKAAGGSNPAIQQAATDIQAQVDALKAAATRDAPPATPASAP